MMMASRRAKTPHSSAHSASALYDLFRDPNVRLLLVSCLVLQISQQLCGINAVFYYSTMFFQVSRWPLLCFGGEWADSLAFFFMFFYTCLPPPRPPPL